jgi:LacI family transcriptional regulator
LATILDVAREAGVGVGTVSRVLNGRERVAPGTRARVLAVIERLDYSPNLSARSLSMGRTEAICVLVPYLTSASVNARLQGVLEGLQSSGREITLRIVDSVDQRDRAIASTLEGAKPAGLLVISLPISKKVMTCLSEAGVATVGVDVKLEGVPSVTVDDREGGRLATRFLLERGHRAIAFVGDADNQPLGFRSSRDRQSGYVDALAKAGIERADEYLKTGPFGRESAHQLTHELLSLPHPPTAIFAASDVQAFGVLEAIRSHSLRVPEDISVIGYDDIELAPYVGLTSVHQPLFESGQLGADLLKALLLRDDVEGVSLAVSVVERDTVAPL